ncbi:MAG TPA: CNNM domain-containing protein, partial [Actinomycetes bacterium]|nr:CNNM domain-containing protein [Actinomycetes bacterium]
MTSNDVVLLGAAVVLVLLAGVLAGADAALSRVSRVAVDQLGREGRRGSERLKQVVADPARYLNVALFLRIACEITAVVLVTVVALDLAAETWEAILVSSVSMLVISYVLVGVAP